MLIIPTVLAMQITDIHCGNPSWAVRSGAPQGRNVHDISYCEDPEHILNGSRPAGRSWLQTECARRWGSIELSDLQAIVRMILGVVDREGIDEVMVWAQDQKGPSSCSAPILPSNGCSLWASSAVSRQSALGATSDG